MAEKYNTPVLQLPHTRTSKNPPRPKVPRKAREAATRGHDLGGIGTSLLQTLWDSNEDLIPGGGTWTDTFIGPNKILRSGVWDVEDDRFEGMEFQSVITLVPVKKSAKAVT